MRKAITAVLVAVTFVSLACSTQDVDDSGMTAKVKAKFLADDKVSSLKIAVSTSDGIVTLTGTVPTELEKDQAQKDAASVDGVKQVVNDVNIDPNSLGATNAEAKADAKINQIEKDVSKSANDDEIKAKIGSKLLVAGVTGVKIDVSSGQVTLSGSVKDTRTKTEAETLASDTNGVKNVNNQLSVGR